MSGETIITIDDFIVAQLIANELGDLAKYNVQFVEYYIPSGYQELINQVKETEENWVELSDGSIRFHKVEYTNVIEETE